jgi:cytidyltransferase-like protein
LGVFLFSNIRKKKGFMMTKVFVSGCFDVLHSGHVRFFEEASQYGDLYVSIGSDKTVFELKNRPTLYNEQERLYMVSSLKFVHRAFVASGSGKLDFENEIRQIKPDIFFVNEDGHSDEKQKFIESLGIRYVVSKRQAKENLPIRSTTSIRQSINR